MAKLTLTTTTAGYALAATLNANNALVEAAMENTLSRDGTTPNTMSADLDMNSNQLNNLAVPVNDQEAATKKYVDDIVTGFTDSATFSAALPYTITGSWDFDQSTDFSQGLRILDAAKTDQVLFGHNGTDMTVTATNTADYNFSGITGNYTFNAGIEVFTNGAFRSYNAGDVESIYMWHDGAAGVVDTIGDPLSLKSISGTAEMRFSGTTYRFLESATEHDTDEAGYGQLWVKSSTPNEMWFTDDTGVNKQVTGTTGSFTGTLTGCTTSPTATFYYSVQKLDATYSKVNMWCPAGLTATSDAATLTVTGVPAACQSTTTQARDETSTIDAGGAAPALVVMTAGASVLTFNFWNGTTYSSVGYTTSGTKGLGTGFNLDYITD